MKLQAAVVFLVLAASPASSYAQDDAGAGVAASFEQLQILVRPGNTVTVVDAGGSQMAGRIQSLTPSVLSLDVDGAPRNFTETDVNLIRQRRGDSLANGAWWGLGVGLSLAVLGILACDDCDFGSEPVLTTIGISLYGAMGTGVGVGIDALVRREQTIYRRPGLAASVRF